MIRRNLWTGLNFSKRLSVVFCLPAFLLCSLFLSLLFSSDTYADMYVGPIHDLGSPSSVDLNEYTVKSGAFNPCVLYSSNNSTTCLTQYFDFGNTGSGGNFTGAIYKPNSWIFGNYDSESIVFQTNYGRQAFYQVPKTSSAGGNVYNDALKFSCSSGKYYYGDSISYSNVYMENPQVIWSPDNNTASPFYETAADVGGGDGTYNRLSNNFYTNRISLVESSVSSNNTTTAIYEVDAYQNTGNLYFTSLGVSLWQYDKFYALDSNGTDTTTSTWTVNGFAFGCSESAVKSTLATIDSNPVPEEPVIPDDFPSSWDSLDNQNNEDAWNIMESMDPADFVPEFGSTGNVISLLLSFFRSFLEVETDKSYCGLYMPAFFGNRFSFGNNGGDNDFLYVNLCDNGFVNALSSDYNWIGIISQQSVYNGNSWFYVGIKGLIYFFCFWLLIKILLGYVYWIYSVIDTTFGLVNDIGDS